MVLGGFSLNQGEKGFLIGDSEGSTVGRGTHLCYSVVSIKHSYQEPVVLLSPVLLLSTLLLELEKLLGEVLSEGLSVGWAEVV